MKLIVNGTELIVTGIDESKPLKYSAFRRVKRWRDSLFYDRNIDFLKT